MRIWGTSHVGMVRKVNEDCYAVEELPDARQTLVVVCDGMGGAKAGEVASKTAVVAFCDYVKTHVKAKDSSERVEETLRAAVAAANDEIWRLSVESPDLEGMGTTLVAMLTSENSTVVVNIGDSRAYLLDDNGINQITTDHSLVSEMIMRGEISRSQAQKHPQRNVITRALGAEKTAQCDTFVLAVAPGQFVLLCSDGLTGEVSEPEMYFEVLEAGAPEKACETLVEIANSRGGHDNITVVLAAF